MGIEQHAADVHPIKSVEQGAAEWHGSPASLCPTTSMLRIRKHLKSRLARLLAARQGRALGTGSLAFGSWRGSRRLHHAMMHPGRRHFSRGKQDALSGARPKADLQEPACLGRNQHRNEMSLRPNKLGLLGPMVRDNGHRLELYLE